MIKRSDKKSLMQHQEINIEVIYKGRCFSLSSTDISSHGLLLGGGILTIPAGNSVELDLRIGHRQWQIDGVVIQARKDQLGILFRRPEPELERAYIHVVRNRLYQAAPETIPASASRLSRNSYWSYPSV